MARNKTYVCFDADTDMWAYKFMKGWKALDHIDFDFDNAHELNNLRDGSTEETIKAKLRERLKYTKVMLVLVGKNTKNLHKFVRWEQEIALAMGIPIAAVYLNGSRQKDVETCPPIIRDVLALHIPYKMATCRWAIDYWPSDYKARKEKGEKNACHLTKEKLDELLAE